MKKVIIIDDEPLARSVIASYLKANQGFEIVAECSNGFEGLKAIEELHPDLIFLDIQMPKINGFEMLELIENPPTVIFTTAFDEYALKAFETSATDYLLKPFSKERFEQAIAKVRPTHLNSLKIRDTANKQPDEHLRIVIKDKASIKILQTDQISHIEAYGDYVKIYSSGKKYVKKKTMSFYEKSLDSRNFVRVHRSFILNVDFLTGIEPFEKNSYRAVLKDGERIPISRTAYTPLKTVLGV